MEKNSLNARAEAKAKEKGKGQLLQLQNQSGRGYPYFGNNYLTGRSLMFIIPSIKQARWLALSCILIEPILTGTD